MQLEWVSKEIMCRHCNGTGISFFGPGWYCSFCGGRGKMLVARLEMKDDAENDVLVHTPFPASDQLEEYDG